MFPRPLVLGTTLKVQQIRDPSVAKFSDCNHGPRLGPDIALQKEVS